jgi:uncharacterized protein YlxP (DUF503 family)
MVVGVLTAEFVLPQASTLKDKRSVVQSMVTRLADRFRVSVAEVGRHDDPRRAVVAVAVVSTTARHVDQVLDQALRFLEGQYPVEVVACEVEHR